MRSTRSRRRPEEAGPIAGEVLDHLLERPLDEFTAVRQGVERELRAAGNRVAASAVRSLRKPAAAVWAIDQAVRRSPELASAYLQAGDEAWAALAAGRAEPYRAALARFRGLMGELASEALTALERGGHAPTAQAHRRIEAVLHAAALGDEKEREALRRGRLLGEPPAVELGALQAMPPASSSPTRTPARARVRPHPAPPPGAAPERTRKRVRREPSRAGEVRREAAQREAERLRRRAVELDRVARQRERGAERAQRRADQASRRAAAAGQEAASAREAATEARRRAKEADAEAARAEANARA